MSAISPPAWEAMDRWLPALRHCGVLRVRFEDDRLGQLYDAGLVDLEPVAGDEDANDWRLTPAGAAMARRLRPRSAAGA